MCEKTNIMNDTKIKKAYKIANRHMNISNIEPLLRVAIISAIGEAMEQHKPKPISEEEIKQILLEFNVMLEFDINYHDIHKNIEHFFENRDCYRCKEDVI